VGGKASPIGSSTDLKDLRKKRKSIEIGHMEAWLTHGRGSFHFENLSSLRTFLGWVLKMTGLLGRGERNALDLRVNEMRLEFENLPPAFDGFRILHLSDLHIDGLAGLADAIAGRIEGLDYDLCILNGDYRFEIYGPYHSAQRYLAELLGRIDAKHGIVGVLGNHDFAEVVPILEDLGVTVLVNRSHEVRIDGESLWLVGLDDAHYYGCDDMEGSLIGVPEDAFRIMVIHSPELYREAEKKKGSLYLCGHTHAGQICLPLVGPVMVNAKCPRGFTSGLWRFGGMQGYTSSGAGSSMVPVRFNCRPEIGLIELRRA
jgi:uncharacterized protein